MGKQERELIGSGARADVYRAGRYALKVFHKGVNPAAIMREAYIGTLVADAGLPVPKVYGVEELEEGLAIKMEDVAGKNLHEAIIESPDRCGELVQKLASLQIEIHRAPVGLPFTLTEFFQQRINGCGALEEKVKSSLLRLLGTLPTGTALCHGDFHGGNVLTDGLRYTIIDWPNACAGHPDSDACRTWLIYALNIPEIADMYLESYCAEARRPIEEVLRWLPVLAGARLSEGFPEEREILYSWIREAI